MVATAEAKFSAPKIRQTNMLINGKWVESRSGKRFKTINPVNETVIAEVAEGDPADVDAAVKAARAAFETGFHLDNGARLERLNASANLSATGLKQSAGLMVNYLYDLSKIEQHHDRFAQGKVAHSRAVSALL